MSLTALRGDVGVVSLLWKQRETTWIQNTAKAFLIVLSLFLDG